MTEPFLEFQTYPDVESALLRWAVAEFPLILQPGHFGVATPLNLQELLADPTKAFLRVERIGGRDDGVTDYATVDIEILASTRRMAYTLAEDVRARLLKVPHRVETADRTIILDRVRTERAPTRLPAEDENIRRFTATYSISARR